MIPALVQRCALLKKNTRGTRVAYAFNRVQPRYAAFHRVSMRYDALQRVYFSTLFKKYCVAVRFNALQRAVRIETR